MRRIEIAGVIASGKTTLAGLLKVHGFSPIFEDFHSNPFWHLFYQDPGKFAFETEITFLLQHYNQVKRQEDARIGACDFSFYLDRAYADLTLSQSDKEPFLAVYAEIMRKLSRPLLIVFLKCSPREALDRIRRRGRQVEDSITIEYLANLNEKIENALSIEGKNVKIVTIDSNVMNFATQKSDQEEVITRIRCELT